MKTASYAQSLHNSTAFTQIKQDDNIASYAWKIPTGRVLSSAVTLIALAEALFFSLATVAFSPLYVFDNERFNVLADDAKDSAKTAAKAAGRIFGFGHIETEKLPAPPAPAPKPPAKPTTLKGRALAFIKARAANVGNTALKNPNTTLVVTTLAVTAAAAYYFGLFDYAASLLNSPKAAATSAAESRVALWTPAVKEAASSSALPSMNWERLYTSAVPEIASNAPAAPLMITPPVAITQAIADSAICTPAPITPWVNATSGSPLAFYPEAAATSAAESRVALWTPAVKEAANTTALPSMSWERLYTSAVPELASKAPVAQTAPLMIAPPAASPQPLFPLNTNWIHWAAQKLNGTK